MQSTFNMKILIALFPGLMVGCESSPPENLAYEETNWSIYQQHQLDYEIKYPDYYRIHEYGEEVIFRYDDFPVLLVRFTDPESAEGKGLWHSEDPVGEIEINAEKWTRYIYYHCDGPFCMRTLSYVRSYGEKEIGIEFRTEKELDEVQQEILESFRLI